ncbi:MFS transporter [Pseudonocardia oroxyli]|uniref:Major Facilitator Superfamily protein n=1 Tax=Pseudonocardia oroxyli TaxID=366584 RepID=A0A1G7YFM2_PSEOR|nr:MFS transporter [Pseudonocardia oroxyli]SDG95233.1 Major Facilitator Superfamily protein [Pseudonocardia oroxyli]
MPVLPVGTRLRASGRFRPSPRPTTGARNPVMALFALAGAVFGSWAARIPDVTEQVGATHATLGVALLCVSLGALASMQLTGLLATRFGAGRVAVAGSFAVCLVVPLPGLAGSIPTLCAALLVFGACTGLVNVAINSAGVAVEARRPDRPLLPFLHAAFSLGGLVGAAVGGVATALGPVLPHLVGVGLVGLGVTAWTRPALRDLGLPATRHHDRSEGHANAPSTTPPSHSTTTPPTNVTAPFAPVRSRDAHRNTPQDRSESHANAPSTTPPSHSTTTPPTNVTTPSTPVRSRDARRGRGLVVLLGLIAGCTAFGEGAITDWGALHLQETLGAGPALAAAGYSCFSLAMACGRLAGGVLLRRIGQTRLLAGGGGLAAAGMSLALLTGSPELALAGFVLVGLGLANLFPIAIARAGAHSGARGVGLASTVGYTGLLGGPPVIGFVAEQAGLPTALALVPVLALTAAALALAVGPARPRVTLPARLPLPRVVPAVRPALRRQAQVLAARGPGPVLRRLVTVPASADLRPGPRGDATRRVVLRPLRPVVRTGRPLMVDARVQPLRIIPTTGARVAVPVRPSMLRGATLVERAAVDPRPAPRSSRRTVVAPAPEPVLAG